MSNNSSSEPSQQDMNELENLYKSSQFNTLENKVEELLKKHSKNVNLHNILGVSLQVQGKLKESLKIFEKIIKLQPNFYLAHYNMGNVLKQSLDLKGAKTCYEKCINFSPTFIDAHIGLGLILLDLNKLAESANVFKMALKLKPEDGKFT